jgi:hypothetical protein
MGFEMVLRSHSIGRNEIIVTNLLTKVGRDSRNLPHAQEAAKLAASRKMFEQMSEQMFGAY